MDDKKRAAVMLEEAIATCRYGEDAAIKAITAALRAAPAGFVLVPVEPTDEWVRAVIRTWQPNLKEGCKGWRELEDELLHWHTAILAARPQGVKDGN